MSIKEKVIFDTNCLYTKTATSFLGNKKELTRFSKICDIKIPDIAIGEIEAKYRRTFEDEKKKFLKTILPSIFKNKFEDVDIDVRIQELKEAEDISYEIITLTDYSVLAQMKDLALQKLPPFEPGDNTDKGFKDAYIYFTILEYLQKIPDKYVFVCVKDNRLKEAFKQHPNIKVIEKFDDLANLSVTRYAATYFLAKINDELGLNVEEGNVIDYWINIDGNTNLLVLSDEDEYVIEVDSGEIISSIGKTDYSDSINSLITSCSYATTHRTISDLESCVNFLNDDEIENLLLAAIDNPQIHNVICDNDVKNFINILYTSNKEILEEETADQLRILLT